MSKNTHVTFRERCSQFVEEMVQLWPEAFDEDNVDEIEAVDFLDTFKSAAKQNGLTFSGES